MTLATAPSFVRNTAILAPLEAMPYAFATFRVDRAKYGPELIEEIAIGQSLGAFDTHGTPAERVTLARKVARLTSFSETPGAYFATLAFPWELWHGQLHWLLTLLFGKMSFYEGVQLQDVSFTPDAFGFGRLTGPVHDADSLRSMTGAQAGSPLLMGILKPNVAMSDTRIRDLFVEAAEAGVHLVKDDEIRFDDHFSTVLKRVELVATEAAKRNLKTLYAVHFQIQGTHFLDELKVLEAAGASALLLNVWTTGLGTLQEIRRHTHLPLLAHPALVGAFGIRAETATIHPAVTLGQLTRAAGADLSLFPSPYGKLGLEKPVALEIARACLGRTAGWNTIARTTPVPSAGIKPEHTAQAKADFGSDFVLNAGTGIFSGESTPAESIRRFREGLYGTESNPS